MFSSALRLPALTAACALLITGCGGSGGGGSSSGGVGGVPVLPTTSPPPPGQTSDFSCPSSATSFAVASSNVAGAASVRRMVRAQHGATAGAVFAVTYESGASSVEREIDSGASRVGGHAVGRLAFDRLGKSIRLVNAGNADPQTVRARLKAIPDVLSVERAHRLTAQTKGATFTNDPYFKGASGTTAPLYQTATTGGQWDMHVVGLEHAFSYGEGLTTVKLAIVDTGEDITHPEIAQAHVVRTQCFITDATGSTQSVGSFVTDPDGHGTDVTGIAAAASNNALGFTGAAGHVGLMLYRVFPTPSDACNDTSNPNLPPECSAWDIDIATAINDAVANGANVINLSLGDDTTPCTNGADPDTIEGNAVANAIAHNVIVVAASSNGGKSHVGAPACDSGVIAVGASAYNDSTANGSGYSGANKEYVASYSDYGSANSAKSASSWGIVAPGGDPTDGNDTDSLHWVENIWTSTPLDQSFAGACGQDPYGGLNDCRIEIAGTSMASPHVAGAAALILSINPNYGSPSAMKQLLCQTADSIGDPHQGCGRLNLYRAAAKAAGDPNLP